MRRGVVVAVVSMCAGAGAGAGTGRGLGSRAAKAANVSSAAAVKYSNFMATKIHRFPLLC